MTTQNLEARLRRGAHGYGHNLMDLAEAADLLANQRVLIEALKTTPAHKREDLHCVASDLDDKVRERDSRIQQLEAQLVTQHGAIDAANAARLEAQKTAQAAIERRNSARTEIRRNEISPLEKRIEQLEAALHYIGYQASSYADAWQSAQKALSAIQEAGVE